MPLMEVEAPACTPLKLLNEAGGVSVGVGVGVELTPPLSPPHAESVKITGARISKPVFRWVEDCEV